MLRPHGTLVLGRTAMPEDGVDGRMKERLDAILADMGVAHERKNAREHVQRWLGTAARGGAPTVASAWDAERTPRGFLERHRTGARFSRLPEPVKDEAMRRLSAWAVGEFGSLDAATPERHAFELQFFTFHDEAHR